MSFASLILLIIALPLINAIILPIFRNRPNLRESVIFIISGFTLLLTLYAFFLEYLGYQGELTLISVNKNIYFGIALDIYNLVFATLVIFLWIISTIYSIGYMRIHNERNQTRFYSFFSLCIFATLGVAFSANLLTSFLFYEILTLATIPLVAHNQTNDKIKPIKTYIFTLIFTSLGLFFTAIMLTISYTGDSTYTSGGIFVNQNIDPKIVLGILLLFIFGVAKTGIMPFHKWLPSAMIAPTPVSALLHGVAVVKSGAFIIFKIFVFIFGVDYLNKIVYQLFDFNYLVIIPSITIIVSSAIAMYQNNIKKRLAYSTISQLSYIILTLCVLTPVSAIAGFLHIIAHAFSKIALFFAAGSILVLTHKDEVSELNGISKDLPITMLVFSIGALSLIGFPLTIGFTSKWFILNGAISAENYLVIFVLILSTILNAIYFISIIAMAYKPTNFDALKEDYINNTGEQETQDHTKHTSKAMNTAMIIVAFMVIALNIYADDLISLITN